MASSGIYEWTLKAISTHPNDQIGIISSIDHAEEMRYLFQRFGGTDCYFWYVNPQSYSIDRNMNQTSLCTDVLGGEMKAYIAMKCL